MGMGVGLAICHGVIEDHHGRIAAANAPEGGAVFTITLPLRPEQRDNWKAES
jgi:signal transduction histidine kinase